MELTTEADLALIDNDLPAAEAALEQLRSTHIDGHHELPVVDALIASADAARQVDDLDRSAELLDEALTRAEDSGYQFGTARASVSSGYLSLLGGPAAQAADAFTSAADIARDLDERAFLAGALTGLGEAKARLRSYDEATAALAEALELYEALGAPVGIVNAAQQLADVNRRERRYDTAATHFKRALEVAREGGPWIGIVNALDGLGEVRLLQGDLNAALSSFGDAHSASEQHGYLRGQAHSIHGLGRCAAADADWTLAKELHEHALAMYRRLGDQPSATNALGAIARASEQLDDLGGMVAARVEAVSAIETMRAAQDRHDYQQEYLHRFAAVYSDGLDAAIRADDPAAFVAMFEGLAGRRLAGLVGDLPQDPVVKAELSSQLLADNLNRPFDGSDLVTESRAERTARLLGRLANRGGLPDVVEAALADVTAALYRPFSMGAAAPLLERVRRRSSVLAIALLPGERHEAVCLAAPLGGGVSLHRWRLSDSAVALIGALASDGLDPAATLDDLAGLGELFPSAISDLPDHGPLALVPLGQLWAVPWPAVPVAPDRLLGELQPLTVAPSLTLADHAGALPVPTVGSLAHWRSPRIRHHELVAFLDDHRVNAELLPSASDASEAVRHPVHDLIVLAGHGRPVPKLGHYLELNDGVYLTPSDLLGSSTPRSLALIACWGAHAPGAEGDPMTLATVAVARGTSQVLATTSELADDQVASTFVNDILYELPEKEMPHALHQATKDLLANPRLRRGYVSRWAPLITVGAQRLPGDAK
ncbi:MAG: tetratricopeptide repeat protein [Microthrixaceae bacterium]|nr:tetratricopeptide repeat protein [Microthrixaceae bacterium]